MKKLILLLLLIPMFCQAQDMKPNTLYASVNLISRINGMGLIYDRQLDSMHGAYTSITYSNHKIQRFTYQRNNFRVSLGMLRFSKPQSNPLSTVFIGAGFVISRYDPVRSDPLTTVQTTTIYFSGEICAGCKFYNSLAVKVHFDWLRNESLIALGYNF